MMSYSATLWVAALYRLDTGSTQTFNGADLSLATSLTSVYVLPNPLWEPSYITEARV